VVNDQVKSAGAREALVGAWHAEGGVLVMGYEMFRLLTSGRAASDGLQDALLAPGPDVVVCDEGHRIKNDAAGVSKALKRIKTRRRIVLTGYPLQNNMMEYWCMVDFVRPNYLGTKHEFANMFENPIKNGQCDDSTRRVRDAGMRPGLNCVGPRPTFVNDWLLVRACRTGRLRSSGCTSCTSSCAGLYSAANSRCSPPCCPRRRNTSSPSACPVCNVPIMDVRIHARPRPLPWHPPHTPTHPRGYCAAVQRELYDGCRRVHAGGSLFQAYQAMMKIWNHPDVLYNAWATKTTSRPSTPLDGGLENMPPAAPGAESLSWVCGEQGPGALRSSMRWLTVNTVQADAILGAGYEAGRTQSSYKLLAALLIMQKALERGDRVLVFSQSLGTLDTLERVLGGVLVPGTDPPRAWVRDRDYFRIDGSTTASDRERRITSFNDAEQTEARCFLVSTKAGGIGINLVAANRVIVLDVGWNPVHAAQAVCRVYRFGQRKPVFIYRMVASNTMEEIIYEREVLKRGLADTVVEQQSVTARVAQSQTDDLYQDRPEEPFDPHAIAATVKDDVLAEMYREYPHLFAKPPYDHRGYLHEHPDQLTETDQINAEKGRCIASIRVPSWLLAWLTLARCPPLCVEYVVQQRMAEGRHLLTTTRYKELTADGGVRMATVQSPLYSVPPRHTQTQHQMWRPAYVPGTGMHEYGDAS
jgi:RAD54-like protein 2